ncbi:MAG: efflux RND transporter permease subunit, partial [Thermodesulfobacteriota bacterium]
MVLRYLLVERPLGTLVALSCLALLGLLSLWGANIRFLPDVRSPFITVTTVLFEADAEEIETLITKKVEDALADTPGLKKMESVSREGESTVSVQ